MNVRLLLLAASLCLGGLHLQASQESALVPITKVQLPVIPDSLDCFPTAAPLPSGPIRPRVSGAIAPAGRQPAGSLSGRIVFTSGGHGWYYTGSGWSLARPILNNMNEDYGNLDQMTMFVFYCFNAGATVVPMRPVGHQTNEVIIDNMSSSVTWEGAWSDSASTNYYGNPNDAVPYRFADSAAEETATATYTPNLPQAGFYPVYTWVLASANRTSQLYRVRHTGGESLVRIPHHLVGNGWVYLGTYYFAKGTHPGTGSVVISNLREGAQSSTVVIADAIRFGNGMGDIDRGGGVSRYPREEECARYWIQKSVGQGFPSTIYDNPSLNDLDDNVGAPIRMAVAMNRPAAGNMYKRIYVSFHSNAGGSRGVMGLWNDPNISTNSNTPNQYRLAELLGTEVNNDMVAITAPPLEVSWFNRSTVTFANTFAYGEINNNTINGQFDATIVEVAYHDSASDALLMRDPKVRNWLARSVYQGVLRYMNQYDGAVMSFVPEPPTNLRAIASSNAISLAWNTPTAQGGSGGPTNYVVYRSTDGYGFGNPINVTSTTVLLTNVEPDKDYYFRIAASNAGGESFPSETVGCRLAANPLSSKVLIVNGFTRFHRTLNLRQTPNAQDYKPPGHDNNTGAIERVIPRQANSFDYVVQHGKAVAATSAMGFDSCQVQAVTNGQVNVSSYQIVLWNAGNQSTNDRTFNAVAQTTISNFLAKGGHLFVSGSDIAWDLDRATGPSAADRSFLHNQLHATLGIDANGNAGKWSFTAAPWFLFDGNASGDFDNGTNGIYWVGSPDAVIPTGVGTATILRYPGYLNGSAGLRYDGSFGGGKVVYLGFPFETIVDQTVREAYMRDTLAWFSRPPELVDISRISSGTVQMTVLMEPGFDCMLETSPDLLAWTSITNIPNSSGISTVTDDHATSSSPRFYRVTLPVGN